MSEVYRLLKEAGCGRGGRRGRVNVIAAGDRNGGGGGCVRGSGRGQYAVDGEQRRADGRRLRDGRGPGRGWLSLTAVGVAAIARFSRRRRLRRRRRRRRQRAVAAFVVGDHRGGGCRGGRRHRRGRHRGHRWRSFRPATVVVAGMINAAVAPAEQSPVQFHSRRPTRLPTVSPAGSFGTQRLSLGRPAPGLSPFGNRRHNAVSGEEMTRCRYSRSRFAFDRTTYAARERRSMALDRA